MSFHDRYWQLLGTKSDLISVLEEVTRIPGGLLKHRFKPDVYSIAQRMSWAADRVTERIEDRAYSLMGLFHVNMEMLYGEREQAFIRLQEHIIQHSADESIFAWESDRTNHPRGYSGLLAPSPLSFQGSGDIQSYGELRSFGFSNLGLSISLPTYPYSMDTCLALLECTDARADKCAILFKKTWGNDQYARVMKVDGQSLLRGAFSYKDGTQVIRQIYVRQNPARVPPERVFGFWLLGLEHLKTASCRLTILSRARTNEADRFFLGTEQVGLAGIVSLKPLGTQRRNARSGLRWMLRGFDDDFNPMIMLASDQPNLVDMKIAPTPEAFDKAVDSGPDTAAHGDLFAKVIWLRPSLFARDHALTHTPENTTTPAQVVGSRTWSDPIYVFKFSRHAGMAHDVAFSSVWIKVSKQFDRTSEHQVNESGLIWAVNVFKLEQYLGQFDSQSRPLTG